MGKYLAGDHAYLGKSKFIYAANTFALRAKGVPIFRPRFEGCWIQGFKYKYKLKKIFPAGFV